MSYKDEVVRSRNPYITALLVGGIIVSAILALTTGVANATVASGTVTCAPGTTTATGTVESREIRQSQANGGGPYTGTLDLVDAKNDTLATSNATAGSVVFAFSVKVMRGQTALQAYIQSPTRSGGVNIPVTVQVVCPQATVTPSKTVTATPTATATATVTSSATATPTATTTPSKTATTTPSTTTTPTGVPPVPSSVTPVAPASSVPPVVQSPVTSAPLGAVVPPANNPPGPPSATAYTGQSRSAAGYAWWLLTLLFALALIIYLKPARARRH